MTTKPTEILCIYCGNRKPPSDEHIVQRSLGGNLRPALACGECNSFLSTIDQALAEQSLISLPRIVRTDPAKRVYLGGTHFYHDEATDLWLEVRVSNGFATKFLPQIHRRDQDFYFRASSQEDVTRLVEIIAEKVADGSLLSTRIIEDSTKHGTTPSIVNYRKRDLRVRACNRDRGMELLKWLHENWPKVRIAIERETPAESQIERPRIFFTQSIRLDDMYRGVAKIAYGYLAYCEGAEFVLRKEFEPIREYIMGQAVIHPKDLPEGAIAVDTRFVQQLPRGSTIGVPTEDHTVMTFYYHPLLLGFVTLYKDSSFIVSFADISLDREIIQGHEFSTDGTKNKALDIMEIGRRIWRPRQAETATDSADSSEGDSDDGPTSKD